MYSIGEFSKINKITPKTLRHYDKIGLLKPSRIDDWTGYRYYNPDKLPEISKILMLRNMGFSLLEIKKIIFGKIDIQNILNEKAGQLQGKIRDEKNRLSKVLGYLAQFEGEKDMKESIIVKSLPEVIVASMRTIIPTYNTFFDIVPKMGEYMKSVGAVCREHSYCFTIYHDGEYRESDIDVEICEAVNEVCQESDKVKFKTIKAVPSSACYMHEGPYETLGNAYGNLFTWINQNGYAVAGKPRESYIDGIWNKENPDEWLTEVQVPVKKGTQIK